MPNRNPLPDWTGQDVWIIGGGPSLKDFDFEQLAGRNTIGCNQAFQLGSAICKICAFGDYHFWIKFAHELGAYKGWVASNHTLGSPPPWLHFFKRIDDGLGTGDVLAWNNNTGCLATNLALTLGAKRVMLIGFDMNWDRSLTHWYEPLEVQTQEHYAKFRWGFQSISEALPRTFPDTEVINVHDGVSRLGVFKSMRFERFGLHLGSLPASGDVQQLAHAFEGV